MPASTVKKISSNAGHRKRVVKKLVEHGHQGLQSYELLEMLLFLILKRVDTKPIAKELIEKFGCIRHVLKASKKDLMSVRGVGEKVYNSLKIIESVVCESLKSEFVKKPILKCIDDVIEYCKFNMATLVREDLVIIFLDASGEVIEEKIFRDGANNRISANHREIIESCLDVGARGLLLIHNHPSGDVTPSTDDIYTTIKLNDACSVLNIQLYDHIIIGKNSYASFKRLKIL